MSAVRAQGVVKHFGPTRALDGIDLEVGHGEVRGLLGPNGAGKTTLLRILLGLVGPDAGNVELFDRPLRPDDPDTLTGVGGFVEDPSFYPYLSGRANLELLSELDGDSAGVPVDDVLAQVGLADRGGDRVNGYSTGMKQRLGIAACLLRAPRLLLLDEPTAGLDPAGVRDMVALVRELASGGVAILISSHQISEVEGVCDSFTFLRHGAVVWNGTAARLRAEAPASAYRLSTSDDARAVAIAEEVPGAQASLVDGSLVLTIGPDALDPYVLALGRAGVAVRRLELAASPLETLFFSLTEDVAAEPELPADSPPRPVAAG